jgi:hypothetical protein
MPADPSRIPFPTYQYGSPKDSYSDAQSWEYHQAFYVKKSLYLIEKHRWARAWALMLSLIREQFDPETIIKELRLLGELFPAQMVHLAEVAAYLDGLSDTDRRQRILDLHELDRRAQTNSFPQPQQHLWGASPNSLSVSPEYVGTVMASKDEMELAMRTGSMQEPEAHKEGRAQWDIMSKFLRNKDKRRNAIWQAENMKNYELVVNMYGEYIDDCLRFAPNVMRVVEQFQICYAYDRLTVNLSKLGRWSAVRERLRQLFGLPEAFFGRSSSSEQQGLRKRLERAENECAKAGI